MSDITFRSVQQVFEHAFRSEQKIPSSITMGESAYKALCENIMLSGYCALWDRPRVTHILCYVTGSMIPLACNADLPDNEIAYVWEQATVAMKKDEA